MLVFKYQLSIENPFLTKQQQYNIHIKKEEMNHSSFIKPYMWSWSGMQINRTKS